jgi:hypothetical protein
MDELSQDTGYTELTLEAVGREARRRADSIASEAALKARLIAQKKAHQDSVIAAGLAHKQRIINEKRAMARKYMVEIYDFLENNKARDAYKRFNGSKEYIRGNIDAQTYERLESSVLEARRHRRKKSGQPETAIQIELVKEETVREDRQSGHETANRGQGFDIRKLISDIYEMLERGEISKADSVVCGNEAAILSGAPPEVFRMLKESIDQAKETLKEQRSREIAKEKISLIYDLIEQGKVAEAYQCFQAVRDKLEKYAGTEPFVVLRQTIEDAYGVVPSYDAGTGNAGKE